MRRKHERDAEKDNVMVAFKIIAPQGLQPQIKFKIDMNAQQLHLSGVCLIADQHTCSGVPHLVLVEGGHTATKRYCKLMMSRINWKDNAEGPAECFLVWKGSNPNGYTTHGKKQWRLIDIRSEQEAKRILNERGFSNMWQQVLNFDPERMATNNSD